MDPIDFADPADSADRTIRVLASAALVVLIAYGVLLHALQAAAQDAAFDGSGAPVLLAELIGRIGLVLGVAIGGAALVISLQRRQRGWAVALLCLLAVAALGGTLAPLVLPLLVMVPGLAQLLTTGVIFDFDLFYIAAPALVPLGALFYVRPRRTTPRPDPDVG
jgi:hypothetical protein